jgi:hypothetical protein
VVVPRSGVFGPGVVDDDGVRRCFGHSVTGAVYAAYSAIAALADVGQAIPTVRKLMVPGPATDVLIDELRKSTSSGTRPPQLAGFRVIDADQDRATVMLALRADSGYVSATLTLRWYDDDWKLVPPQPGDPVGAPFALHRDLDDFVAWSGI